jgi:DNA-binding transcriptional ArsR family regulator
MSKTQSPTVPTCESVHALESNRIKQLDPEKAQRMAEFFRLLGDANRLRILSVLAKQKLCVCDLAAILEMSESAVSHQLRTLRSLRLVNYQKQGRKVYYDLQDHHVLDLYNSVAEHLDESETEE